MQHPAVVPWVVAEAIGLEVATRRPRSVHVTRDPGGRVARHLELDDAIAANDPSLECLVWVGDGLAASVDARAHVLALAPGCRDLVVLVEPLVPGCGIGLHLLRAIDPALRVLATEEVTCDDGRTRERKPWEPCPRWAIAIVRAWRFAADAELARMGFLERLPRMSAADLAIACRRLLTRFDRAHEVVLLGARELVRRGDHDGAHRLAGELLGDAPASLAAETRRVLYGPSTPPFRRTA